MSINKEYLNSHLMSLKIQLGAARKQVAVDRATLDESKINLHRIEGSLTLVKNLITVADSMAEKEKQKTESNGNQHS